MVQIRPVAGTPATTDSAVAQTQSALPQTGAPWWLVEYFPSVGVSQFAIVVWLAATEFAGQTHAFAARADS